VSGTQTEGGRSQFAIAIFFSYVILFKQMVRTSRDDNAYRSELITIDIRWLEHPASASAAAAAAEAAAATTTTTTTTTTTNAAIATAAGSHGRRMSFPSDSSRIAPRKFLFLIRARAKQWNLIALTRERQRREGG
jgi:hypothetical protein